MTSPCTWFARAFRAARLLALALPLQSGPLAAATFAGVELPPPLAEDNVVDNHWGTAVDDPYRFLENTQEPRVVSWMKAQSDATAAILARLPGRAALLSRLAAIDAAGGGAANSIVRTRSGRYFYLRREPEESQFKLVRRDGADGRDTVVFDPEALSRTTGRAHAVMDFAPSPDGTRLAYAVQAGGSEIGRLHVIDVVTGRELMPPVEGIRYASASWLDDSSGFFYSRLAENYEQQPRAERLGNAQRRFRSLDGDGVDRLVFSAGFDPALPLPPEASAHVAQITGTRLAAASVALGVDRNHLLFVADLDDATRGRARWRPIATAADQVVGAAAGGGWAYLRTSAGAPRYRVVRVPLADPELARARTVLAESEGVIVGMAAARDALYVTRREGATLSLLRIAHGETADVERIELPFAGNVRIVHASADRDGAIVVLGSWTRTAKHYAYDPASKSLVALPLVRPGAFDAPDSIVAREVRVASHDGVEVPLSIIARKDLALDGRHPTLLYGYGAYGTTEDPGWSPRLLAWLERGGVYAIAHVRGGGAFGEDWHRAGMKATKPNTWLDGIAAAQWLIDNHYTSPPRLAVQGGSAGGIFVGRALTARPDLFAAAVVSVGNTDLVRSETRANGLANVPEYGSVRRQEEFRALLAMSPYANVRADTAYPAVLFEHGVNDLRVDVWNSLKTGSRLAAATNSGRPVLLRLEYDGGHGSGATREQGLQRTADRWAFLLWQFGDPTFQPQP